MPIRAGIMSTDIIPYNQPDHNESGVTVSLNELSFFVRLTPLSEESAFKSEIYIIQVKEF